MFVELTVSLNSNARKYLLNTDHIVLVKPLSDSGDTEVVIVGSQALRVKESYEAVRKLIYKESSSGL